MPKLRINLIKNYIFNGTTVAAPSLSSGLYIVATPIGSLKDITIRALEVLSGVDIVLCEDTRHSAKLLNAYGIKAKLMPYHDHNGENMRPYVVDKLREGLSLALISDAGTPLIADPGFKLVRDLAKEGFTVTPIAGASALITALSVAGLPTDCFLFDGFLPSKQQARLTRLEKLKSIDATLVFYESANRLNETLQDALSILGEREAVVARELTKMHEELRRGTLSTLITEDDLKGEIVLIIAPPDVQTMSEDKIDALLAKALLSMSVKEAAHMVSEATGLAKRPLYQRALELK